MRGGRPRRWGARHAHGSAAPSFEGQHQLPVDPVAPQGSTQGAPTSNGRTGRRPGPRGSLQVPTTQGGRRGGDLLLVGDHREPQQLGRPGEPQAWPSTALHPAVPRDSRGPPKVTGRSRGRWMTPSLNTCLPNILVRPEPLPLPSWLTPLSAGWVGVPPSDPGNTQTRASTPSMAPMAPPHLHGTSQGRMTASTAEGGQ